MDMKSKIKELKVKYRKKPFNDKHMNKLANLLDRYASLRNSSSYKFDRTDVVVDFAVEVELIAQEMAEARTK